MCLDHPHEIWSHIFSEKYFRISSGTVLNGGLRVKGVLMSEYVRLLWKICSVMTFLGI